MNQKTPRKKQGEVEAEAVEQHAPATAMKATVLVKGIKPLLMSAPTEIYQSSSKAAGTKKKTTEYIDEDEAEKRAYRDKEGYLVVPARCIFACLVKASRLFKTKARTISFQDMVKGSVSIAPQNPRILDLKGNPIKKYEIDRALVVVQRSRILRCRPRIDEWQLRFDILWNPKIYGLTSDNVHDVVNDAAFIGLLDWRPTFGIFEIKSFEPAPVR